MTPPWRVAVRFFRTPKGLLTIVLAVLLAIAAAAEGVARVAPGLVAATLAAMAIDLPILRIRSGDWEFPSGALLTGWIVAMVLSPHEPWHVPAVTAGLAVVSKYIVRTRSANVFNPAGLALIASYYLFNAGQDWWGAVPTAAPAAIAVLIAGGVFIADRVNKLPLALAFLGVYFLLFTVAAFARAPLQVAEIFRAPDLHAALYFAFFMITDPPTAPIRLRDQLTCGVLVAVVSVAAFELTGALYYMLAGLMAGNVWEAWRRHRLRAARAGSSARVE